MTYKLRTGINAFDPWLTFWLIDGLKWDEDSSHVDALEHPTW